MPYPLLTVKFYMGRYQVACSLCGEILPTQNAIHVHQKKEMEGLIKYEK